MRLVGNVIWLVLSGFWLAVGYALAGVLACLLVITIPFGLQSFKLAGYCLWPFGRTLVKRPTSGGLNLLANVLWLVIAGWWLALAHLLAAGALLVACALIVTIPICLPFAVANLKLTACALWPFGREVVDARAVSAAYANAIAVPAPRRRPAG